MRQRHTLRGCVDWNTPAELLTKELESHTLRGCVDWNQTVIQRQVAAIVTPCVGVWIETRQIEDLQHQLQVTPCVGVWIETETYCLPGGIIWVTPCVGVWIETFPDG